jgi:hypothetical protein
MSSHRALCCALATLWTLTLASGPAHAEPAAPDAPPAAEVPAEAPPAEETPAEPAASSLFQAQNFQLSGFGTLGLVHTSDRDVRFIRPSVNNPGSANPDLGPDTVIGVQGNYTFSPSASVVFQAISRENARGSFMPRANLAFASYTFIPGVTLRAGRLRTPFFMLSETLDVNYAHPWIRPPTEVYSLLPFNDLNGVDLLINTQLGGFNIELHPYFGNSRLKIYQNGEGRLKDLRGLNISATHGPLTLFASHGEARFGLKWSGEDFRPLAAALKQAIAFNVPNASKILRDISGNDGFSSYSGFGIQWDDNRWLLIGEYNQLRSLRYTHDAHAWALTAAYRFGDLMPYLTLARHSEDKPMIDVTTGYPGLDQGVHAFIGARNLSQRSITLGARWDFYQNTALKIEFNHARITGNAWGSFFAQDVFNTRMQNRSINTVGVSVDVTF